MTMSLSSNSSFGGGPPLPIKQKLGESVSSNFSDIRAPLPPPPRQQVAKTSNHKATLSESSDADSVLGMEKVVFKDGFSDLDDDDLNTSSSHDTSAGSHHFLPGIGGPTIVGDGGLLPGQRFRRIKRISKYVVGAVMGEGAYGCVRDALDLTRTTVERVAVKLLKRPPLDNSSIILGADDSINLPTRALAHQHGSLSRITRTDATWKNQMIDNEIEKLQRFHHPNVIRAVDIFTRRDKEYVVLPVAVCSLQHFVDFRRQIVEARTGLDSAAASRTASYAGGNNGDDTNLHAAMRFSSKQICPAPLVKDLIIQLLTGLQYMHSQSAYHNDLKPSNILLFGDGSIKLTDLGCCNELFVVGRYGTPAFVSPQVVSNLIGHENAKDGVTATEKVDPAKNDVWAVGVILYLLLTGRLPIRATTNPGHGGKSVDFAIFKSIVDDDIDFSLVPMEGDPSRKSVQNRNAKRPTSSRSGSKAPVSEIEASLLGDSFVDDTTEEMMRGGNNAAIAGFGFGAASGRELVRALLSKNQSKRLTVTEALNHPWLKDALGRSPRAVEAAAVGSSPKPLALSESMHHPPFESSPRPLPTGSESNVMRVLNVKEIADIIEADYIMHMQLVAEVAHILRLPLPASFMKVPVPEEIASTMLDSAPPTKSALMEPTKSNCLFCSVDGSRFMSEYDMTYYARKQRGKADHDVVTLRNQPNRRAQLFLYIDGLVTVCEGSDGLGIPGNTRGISMAGREGFIRKVTGPSNPSGNSNGGGGEAANSRGDKTNPEDDSSCCCTVQ